MVESKTFWSHIKAEGTRSASILSKLRMSTYVRSTSPNVVALWKQTCSVWGNNSAWKVKNCWAAILRGRERAPTNKGMIKNWLIPETKPKRQLPRNQSMKRVFKKAFDWGDLYRKMPFSWVWTPEKPTYSSCWVWRPGKCKRTNLSKRPFWKTGFEKMWYKDILLYLVLSRMLSRSTYQRP